MIRVVCAWMLIVLAASPFTAPFSTCDVSALLGTHTSTVAISSVATCPEIGDCSSTSDAGSVSPLVLRIVLTRNAVLVPSDWPVPQTADKPLRAALLQPAGDRTREDSPLQPTVLRL
jgi:hypothetical protein